MRPLLIAAATLALGLSAPALAQEATATAQPTDAAGQAIAEWGRRVMAGQPTADLDAPAAAAAPRPDAPGARRCAAQGPDGQPTSDGKPHGAVWGGIGNHGYREVGAVVTQPLGPCASLTIAVDRTEGAFGPRRRR